MRLEQLGERRRSGGAISLSERFLRGVGLGGGGGGGHGEKYTTVRGFQERGWAVLKLQCAVCDQTIARPDDQTGKVIKCPRCGGVMAKQRDEARVPNVANKTPSLSVSTVTFESEGAERMSSAILPNNENDSVLDYANSLSVNATPVASVRPLATSPNPDVVLACRGVEIGIRTISIFGKTFATANVTSVSVTEKAPEQIWPALMIAASVLCFAITPSLFDHRDTRDGGWFMVFLGLGLVASGVAWLWRGRPIYSMHLITSAGERETMTFQNRNEAHSFKIAIETAIAAPR